MKIKILIILLTLFLSCKTEPDTSILGTWTFYSFVIDGKEEVFNYQKFVELDGCEKKHYLTFEKDSFKRVKIDFHSCNEETVYLGSYSVKNNDLIMTDKSYSLFSSKPKSVNEITTFTYTYEVNNDFLIIREEGKKMTYKKLKQ